MVRFRTACLILLTLASCAPRKPASLTDFSVLRQHPRPLKIFGIGRWGKGHMALTLTDAQGQYFTIIVPNNEALKAGDIFVF